MRYRKLITKINNSRIGAYSVIPQNKPKGAHSIPSFSSNPDAFVRTLEDKDIPIPISNAISKALGSIGSTEFERFEQALLNEGSAGIKNLYLKAKKVNDKIILKIVYENDEGKGNGGFMIASGSSAAVKEEVKSATFMSNLREKLGKASDDEIYRPTKKLDD